MQKQTTQMDSITKTLGSLAGKEISVAESPFQNYLVLLINEASLSRVDVSLMFDRNFTVAFTDADNILYVRDDRLADVLV